MLFQATLLHAAGKPFAKWTSATLTLNNGLVERSIKLPNPTGSFLTTVYKPVVGEFSYFQPAMSDFQFEVSGTVYSGKDNWTLSDIRAFTDQRKGDGAAITLVSHDKKVEVTIQFLLYPDNPAIRKNLVVKNLTGEAVKLESVDIEKFEVVGYHPNTFSWICGNYGRRRTIGTYEGNMHDALLTIHNSNWKQGIVIGNEVSGVLKRTAAFWGSEEIVSGFTHKEARYPFRKWIKPNDSFSTPQVFTMVYNDHKDPVEMLNTAVPHFVNHYMGIRLAELEQKPTFVYNTWVPFKKDINEKMIMELAKSAADAGMKEFVIDDGWQDGYGDWNIDTKKFPNGLKPVFDYIKSLGMKPGLWVSVGSASSESKVYHEHPEWFVHDKDGNFANLQLAGDVMDVRSACFSTGWKDYIKEILLRLAVDYGLEYLKLDFAVVTSAYRFNHEESGCYSTSHSGHKDHHESMYVNYERMWELFDELHAAKPNLFIDCTFEAMGGLQLIDYAMVKHAEGNWLSNFNGPDEKIDLRIRNMAWWRSPAMPATALVIGNPEMQDKGWELHIQSLAGALPIMLGDPRKLSIADFKKYRAYADWLQLMEERHSVMMYRQDLIGFGEPMEGMWDGFQRINTDTNSGGLIGVFRHGALEMSRQVYVRYLESEKKYVIKEALTGKVILNATGNTLAKKGFSLTISEMYGGKLFEISAQ